MGIVYRARDLRLGREVAIKVLPEIYSRDAGRLKRFEQEARAAGMLNHPNILTIHDTGTYEGCPYIVSELLDGQILRKRLEEAVRLTRRSSVDFGLQMARGLAAAHEKEIVHRDLKPENVFITRDELVKILDFGLAKLKPHQLDGSLAPNAKSQGPSTASGLIFGTVGYMSPEQVRGEEVDHRSDVFAFGAILYEMLTGRRAFNGESAVEVMNAILKEDPSEIADDCDLPPPLVHVVNRCLEKDASDRFQSIKDAGFCLAELSGIGHSRAAPGVPRTSLVAGTPGRRL